MDFVQLKELHINNNICCK